MAQVVSVVVASYNAGRYLDEAIASIQAQSFRDIEIVVVDDCSTDRSVERVTERRRRDPRIVLVRNRRNLGVTATRRRGIDESSGQLVTTLDSDDLLWHPRKIEAEVELIRRAGVSSPVVAYSGIVHVDRGGRFLRSVLDDATAVEGSLFLDMLIRAVPIPRDMTFSRALYERVGGYDAAIPIYEDWDLKLRLARVAEYRYSGIVGVAYRRHGQGLSSDRQRARYWLERVFERNARGMSDLEDLRERLHQNAYRAPLARLRRRLRALLRRPLR